mgnify:CR=1 FL=1
MPTTTHNGHKIKYTLATPPAGFDWAGQVWVDDLHLGLAYGQTGVENATKEQQAEALVSAIAWDIDDLYAKPDLAGSPTS